jgi:hypothetical protein
MARMEKMNGAASPMTDDQLDGRACIHCGRESIQMVPCGNLLRGRMAFACDPPCTGSIGPEANFMRQPCGCPIDSGCTGWHQDPR